MAYRAELFKELPLRHDTCEEDAEAKADVNTNKPSAFHNGGIRAERWPTWKWLSRILNRRVNGHYSVDSIVQNYEENRSGFYDATALFEELGTASRESEDWNIIQEQIRFKCLCLNADVVGPLLDRAHCYQSIAIQYRSRARQQGYLGMLAAMKLRRKAARLEKTARNIEAQVQRIRVETGLVPT